MALPDLDFTSETSEALMEPLRAYILAKVSCRHSLARLQLGLRHVAGIHGFVSTRVTNKHVHAHCGIRQVLEQSCSVTLLKVTVIFCTSVTPVRFTVIVLPSKLGLPETLPVPLVTLALPLTTLLLKVKTSV